jgi:hypothetical protein
MEQSESPRRSLLSEGIALAVIPAIIYLCAYRFDCAYCALFGVPAELIKPELGSILLFCSLTVTLVFITCWILYSWANTLEEALSSTKYPMPMHFFNLWWPFLALALVFFSNYRYFYYLESWWSVPIGLVLIAFLHDAIRLVTSKEPEPRKRFALASVFIRFRQAARQGRLPGNVLMVIALAFWFAFAVSHLLGQMTAFRQTQFSVYSANTNTVLLRSSGDTAICALLDMENKRPTGSYLILKLDSATNRFDRRKIGPLKFPKAPWLER